MAKTILAVDDSSSLRQMVAFSLKAAGYQVWRQSTDRMAWKRPSCKPWTWC